MIDVVDEEAEEEELFETIAVALKQAKVSRSLNNTNETMSFPRSLLHIDSTTASH